MKKLILIALLSVSVSFAESSINCFWEQPIREHYGKAQVSYMCIDNNLYIVNLKVTSFKGNPILTNNKPNMPIPQMNLQIESVAPVFNTNSSKAINCDCRVKVEGN